MRIDLLTRLTLRLFILLSFFTLNACALFDVRETVTYGHNSKPVPEEVIDGIRIHKTTRDWVLENVGEPDKISRGHNTSEIFTYRFEEYRTQRVRVFLLFSFKKNVIDEKHVYVHFVGGVVHKFWRDYELPAVPADEFDVARPAPPHPSVHAPSSYSSHAGQASHGQSANPEASGSKSSEPKASESGVMPHPPQPRWSESLDPLSEDVERY